MVAWSENCCDKINLVVRKQKTRGAKILYVWDIMRLCNIEWGDGFQLRASPMSNTLRSKGPKPCDVSELNGEAARQTLNREPWRYIFQENDNFYDHEAQDRFRLMVVLM